jgi:hypothetical protein
MTLLRYTRQRIDDAELGGIAAGIVLRPLDREL